MSESQVSRLIARLAPYIVDERYKPVPKNQPERESSAYAKAQGGHAKMRDIILQEE